MSFIVDSIPDDEVIAWVIKHIRTDEWLRRYKIEKRIDLELWMLKMKLMEKILNAWIYSLGHGTDVAPDIEKLVTVNIAPEKDKIYIGPGKIPVPVPMNTGPGDPIPDTNDFGPAIILD